VSSVKRTHLQLLDRASPLFGCLRIPLVAVLAVLRGDLRLLFNCLNPKIHPTHPLSIHHSKLPFSTTQHASKTVC